MIKFICLIFVLGLSVGASASIQYVELETKKEENASFYKLITNNWEVLRSIQAPENDSPLRSGYLFYADKIKSIIELCLNYNRCASQANQKEALGLILQNLAQYPKVELLFVGMSESDIFFSDDEGEVERLAKTGFAPEFPILINEKVVEASKDYTVAISLIVHELGHQAGMSSHSFLDALGAEVRRFYRDEQFFVSFQKRNSVLTFFTIPLRGSGQDEFYVNYKKTYAAIPYSLKCRLGELQTASVSMLTNDENATEPFGRAKIWWNVVCVDKNLVEHYEFPEIFLDFYINPKDNTVSWKFLPVKN